jgi:hypothetical protein
MTGTELKYILAMSFIAAMGLGLWIWSWYLPLYENQISIKMAALGPCFTVLGIGLLAMPYDPESPYAKACESAKENGEKVPFRDMPTKYKALTVVAIATGIINAGCIHFNFVG